MIATIDRPNTLLSAMRHFTPDVAEGYIASIKWPDGPCCPKCGSVNVGEIKSRRRHQCREKGCRQQFSLTTGTILEGTHLRSDQWVAAVWMIVNCRNGVSSCEIARTIGCKQQSAWHLLHRIRHILAGDEGAKLSGVVETDSTLVGGRLGNMPVKRRRKIQGQNPRVNKAAVHALRERRTGRVRAAVVQSERSDDIQAIVAEHVETGSCLHTDESRAYSRVSELGIYRLSVNHGKGEYVRGTVTVNGCENFFSCLRRALKGTYIKATPGHLAAYVDEAVYRFNVREMTEWERFDSAMRRIVGKRLTYSTLTDGAVR